MGPNKGDGKGDGDGGSSWKVGMLVSDNILIIQLGSLINSSLSYS